MGNKNSGFSSMPTETQRKASSLGGKTGAGGRAVPREKRFFYTNREAARLAGRKGGQSVPPEKRIFFRDRQLAATAARIARRPKNV